MKLHGLTSRQRDSQERIPRPEVSGLGMSARGGRGLRFSSWLAMAGDYWQLTKPEVNFLVAISALAGFYLGWRGGPLDGWLLGATLIGTLLVAGGTGTLNQVWERKSDGAMRRTAHRPLPAGRMNPRAALAFGLLLAAAGGALLWWAANPLASLLALATLASYLLFYTPLKRRTPLCTLVGAFPGAMPPLIGWAAARGSLDAQAWGLYAILFFWQFPHFLAIAWMYREDYERAGLRMLPARDREGRFTAREILAFTLALLPVSMFPVVFHQVGTVYLWGTALAGLGFLFFGVRLARERSRQLARQVVLASVAYLPLVFALMMANKL
jgi:heme o synthase